MGRERQPLTRNKSSRIITIDINSIWRNPDIQNNVIKEIKRIEDHKKAYNDNLTKRGHQ